MMALVETFSVIVVSSLDLSAKRVACGAGALPLVLRARAEQRGRGGQADKSAGETDFPLGWGEGAELHSPF